MKPRMKNLNGEKEISTLCVDRFDIEFCKRIECCFNLALHIIVQVLLLKFFKIRD